ncbi:MAG: TldD/PmbA family protein [Candidatus Velthaea sp.]
MKASERAAIAEAVLSRSRADGTEVSVDFHHQALTRFTHEAVSQNVDEANVTVRVRALVDGRTGVAATNAFDAESLYGVVARARELATFAPRESIEPTLAGPADLPAPAGAYVAATANASPHARARVTSAMFEHARTNGLWSSGYVTTSAGGITIATSNGARLSHDFTDAGTNVKMNGSDASGFAERYSNDFAAIDGKTVGARAARKALDSRNPLAVEPGEWTVILEPPAVGELLRYLTEHFSAQTFGDGASFISGKLGERVLGENVTIRDDYTHALNPGMPFDFEGFATQRVPLVEGGVARTVVTDSAWSRRLNVPNTGHALPAPNPWGPQSEHTVVEPGTKSVEQLISETKRGLLITRLWYVRIVDQQSVLLTGMTRDGTFLIENGKVTRGVRNMRFNQSIVTALGAAEIASVQERTGGYSYALVTPSVKFERFRFASASPY